MSETVSWNLQCTVLEGRLEDARAVMTALVAASEQESGTVGYEWFLSDDGNTCHICERFANSDAAMAHIMNFGANFADRFMTCFAPTALFVYGEPGDALRAALGPFGAVFLGTLGGFHR